MNDNRYFTLVVPLSQTAQKMAQDRRTALSVRQSVWSQAAEHLKPLLGKNCDSFYPAAAPYGGPLNLPFGVALGCTESEHFLMCYLHARELQEKEIETRNQAIRSMGKRIGQFHPDDETTLTVTAFRSSDPKLQEHLEVARRFFPMTLPLQPDFTTWATTPTISANSRSSASSPAWVHTPFAWLSFR